jgi:hypothetical protein
MKKDFLTIAVLFLVIIFVALWFSSTPSYVPYSASIFRNYSKFEGFSTRSGQEYTSASDNSAIDGPVMNYLISQPTSGPKAVAGFGGVGVFNSPNVATDEKIDIYSQAKGSIDSDGYGYYNSRGPLVLTPEMKTQLQTRGGNTTGCSSTVGGSPA